MDGVLVDVTASYRQMIKQAVAHFTGIEIENQLIQDYKNRGGWNDDWELSGRIIADLGPALPIDEVASYCRWLTFDQGLINQERWLADRGLLERLQGTYQLAIFTGRPLDEARATLVREGFWGQFTLLTSDDVRARKPSPEGLLILNQRLSPSQMTYVGDNVDDARCAARAGARFVGIAAPSSPRLAQLRRLFRQEGALAIIGDVNQIESVL